MFSIFPAQTSSTSYYGSYGQTNTQKVPPSVIADFDTLDESVKKLRMDLRAKNVRDAQLPSVNSYNTKKIRLCCDDEAGTSNCVQLEKGEGCDRVLITVSKLHKYKIFFLKITHYII